MPAIATWSFAESLLEAERQLHADAIAHLRAEIDQLARERAVLSAERDRLQTALTKAEEDARRWRTLNTHVNSSLADDFADQINVRLEHYQDDGSGRLAVCLDQESIVVDLSEEEFIPAEVTVSKELPDGSSGRFCCRLVGRSLRYEVEYCG